MLNINSKLLLWIVSIFGILNLIDVITAMFILDGESNPIYLLTHSISALWIIKGLFVCLIFWVYFSNKYPSDFFLYSYVYLMIIGCFMVGLGIVSNLYGILNPAVLAAATEVSTGEKLSYYAQLIGFLLVIPYIISMASFKTYQIVKKKVVIIKHE